MYVRGDGDNALNDWLPPYNGAAGYFGAGYPTATWSAVMKADLEGLPVQDFPPPAYVTGDPPEAGHTPTTAPPPQPTTHTTSAPTSSAPTSQATTSAPPTSSPTKSTGPPSCLPSTCHTSSPTETATSSPTGSSSAPTVRPVVMASREPWW
jgi:hypothetical protein